MKELNFEQMAQVEGGNCALNVLGHVMIGAAIGGGIGAGIGIVTGLLTC